MDKKWGLKTEQYRGYYVLFEKVNFSNDTKKINAYVRISENTYLTSRMGNTKKEAFTKIKKSIDKEEKLFGR